MIAASRLSVLWILVAALVAVSAAGATGRSRYMPRGIANGSIWIDSGHAWASPVEPSEIFVTKSGGRRWLGPIFRGGNYVHKFTLTSRRAGVVETGNWGGFSLWTNDRGRFWYSTNVFGVACYANCAPGSYRRIERSGRGNLLFWHDHGDTLYRVLGWPPKGHFPCEEFTFGEGQGRLPSHSNCAAPADEAGLRSVAVARLTQGFFGTLRYVPGGAISTLPARVMGRVPRMAVWRDGLLSEMTLPDVSLEETDALRYELAAAWPRIYLTAEIWRQAPPYGRVGSALWRSADRGATWTVDVARTPPSRAPVVSGEARAGRARTWFPGGFLAEARIRGRRVVMIRRLGRTRLLALRGVNACSAVSVAVDRNLSSPSNGLPQVFVEGRRQGSVAAVWWSGDAGRTWTRFGSCAR